MGEDATKSRWFRIAFGRPRLRNGVLLLVPAVCLLAFTVSTDGEHWSYYLTAAIWALFGGVMLTIALVDRRNGRGAYAPPTGTAMDEPVDEAKR